MKRRVYRISLLSCLLVFVLITGVVVYQNLKPQPINMETVGTVEQTILEPVSKEEETLIRPVDSSIKIVRYFYDKDDDETRQSSSLVNFEGVYRPNQGVDFANENQAFEVLASLSGKVISKKEDPLFGMCVEIESEEGIIITYQSLSDVKVELNAQVKQGDVIASSGENIYESDLGSHLHFIIEKNGQVLNPEKCFDKLITQL